MTDHCQRRIVVCVIVVAVIRAAAADDDDDGDVYSYVWLQLCLLRIILSSIRDDIIRAIRSLSS